MNEHPTSLLATRLPLTAPAVTDSNHKWITSLRVLRFTFCLLATIILISLRVPPLFSEELPLTLYGFVTNVIDGDTIQVQIDDSIETVRYIGIHTPDIHPPTGIPALFGTLARDTSAQLVKGQFVTLVLGVQQRDRYGRLLAYVYVGTVFINAELLYAGVAEVATFPPNVLHRQSFIVLEREARTARRGFWSHDAARKYRTPARTGVIASKHVGTYFHTDDDSWAIRGEVVYFDSAQDAQAAGFTPSFHYALLLEREYRALHGRWPSATAVSIGLGYSPSARSITAPGGSGSQTSPGYDVNVKGHYRGGTWVPPHTRSRPNPNRR